MQGYLKYLLVSYATALAFETLANTIGDGTLFRNPHWLIYFIVWYGFMYSLLYVLFANRPLIAGIIFFAVFGSMAEIFVFHRSNLLIDPIMYALMSLIPLMVYKRFFKLGSRHSV